MLGVNIKPQILISDFFKSLHKQRKPPPAQGNLAYYQNLLNKRHPLNQLKVFLCGKELGEEAISKHFDKRYRIKAFINSKMGCSSFLGEDIQGINQISIDENALSIEVVEAESSDLIFIFLESFGTTAELAAFVMSKDTVDKVVVFNDVSHRNSAKPSFLSVGPLKLLETRNPRSVIYFDPTQLENGISDEIIAHLDGAISRKWHEKCIEHGRLNSSWTYELFVTLGCIYALFPITDAHLERQLLHRISSLELKQSLWKLRNDGWIDLKQKTFYAPVKSLSSSNWNVDFLNDISDCRAESMFAQLSDPNFSNHFRVIL